MADTKSLGASTSKLPVLPLKTSRIRAPCHACKVAKRKCDLVKPRCLRCEQRNVSCVPSASARWRNHTTESKDLRISRRRQPVAKHAYPTRAGPKAPSRQQDDMIPLSNALGNEMLFQLETNEEYTLPDIGCFLTAEELDKFMDETQDSMNFEPWIDEQELLMIQSSSFQNTQLSNEIKEAASAITPRHLMDFDASGESCAIGSLWCDFLRNIISGITLCGNHPNNPVVTFLASTAPKEEPLFSAAIFLASSVRSISTLGRQVVAKSGAQLSDTTSLGQAMEHKALEFTNMAMARRTVDSTRDHHHLLVILSVLVTLCSAYIALGDEKKLMIQLEHAVLLVQKELVSDHADNDTFLFLVKWVGYAHTIAMLTERDYHTAAPDILSIASDSRTSSARSVLFDTSIPTEDNLLSTDNNHSFFADVESFTGISKTTSAILYRLGRLLRSRDAASRIGNHGLWLCGDFEADVDELEIRIHRFRKDLTSHRRAHKNPSNLERYNDSLLHTAHLIFLSRIRDKSIQSTEVVTTVDLILESCAGVPADSLTGKLMVLPLYMAGSRSMRSMHQEFVRNRLEKIHSDYCVTDVARTLCILDEEWRRDVRSSKVLAEGSVCALF